MATTSSYFRKELLPPARVFYERELDGRLSRTDRHGRARTSCPFHKGKSRGVFSVNLITGAFTCFSCGVHGGDIIDFIRQRDGLSFKAAAQQLNAWDAAPSPEDVRRIEAAKRERAKQRIVEAQIKAEQHRQRMELREQLHAAIKHGNIAAARLQELRAGATPTSDSEEDACWEILGVTLELERQLALEYRAAAGLELVYGE